MRKFRISLGYYRTMAPFNILLSVACAGLMFEAGSGDANALLICFKCATLGIALYLTSVLRPREIYYYRNLEISRTLLFTAAGVVDLLLFAFVMVFTANVFL